MYCFQSMFMFIVLLGCTTISTVNALNCYQCNSKVDKECADLRAHLPHIVAPFHQPCDDFDSEGNPAFCRTISYKFKFLKNTDIDKSRVIRTCGYKRSDKECYSYDNDHHLENVCQCFSEGCNSAPNLSIFSVFSTIVVASSMYIFG